MGKRRGEYRVLVGNPGEKRPLGRPRHKWKDNMKMDLQEVGWGGIGWIDLAQDRDSWWVLMNMVLKALYDPGEACSTNGGEQRCIQGFGGETCRKESTWKTSA
jgi:hypothetical protein